MSRGTEAPEVAVELVPASLEANLDSLEAYVTGAVEELSAEGLDCTDPDNYRWAKGARAQLNRMAKAVSQERNRVKRDYMRPFKAFEDRCKAIERKATDAAKRLGEPIAEADEAWRARRTAELEAFYAEGADLLAPVVPLPRLMGGERWLRRSCSLPKAQEEMAAKVAKVADGWEALKAAGLGDALPDAERAYFETLDVAAAIAAGRDAADAKARIAEMAAAVAPEPLPEPGPVPEPEQAPEPATAPATWRPGPEDYARMAGEPAPAPEEPRGDWHLTVTGATRSEVLALVEAMRAMGLHGSIRREGAAS